MSYQNHIKSIYGPYMGHPRCLNWTCAISKPYQIHLWAIYGSPTLQKLDFGLWARVFSADLAPTILFSNSPAVFLSKPRDFRFHEPTIPFFQLVSGFPFQTTWLPVPWAHHPFFQLVSGFPSHFRWWRHSTNQKPGLPPKRAHFTTITQRSNWMF